MEVCQLQGTPFTECKSFSCMLIFHCRRGWSRTPILCKAVERMTHIMTACTVQEALCMLWRSKDEKCGEKKVLVIVTDSAAYMLKGAECFQVFYAKIIHLSCLSHGNHRVTEEVRATLSEINCLISSAKVFIKAPSPARAFQTAHPDCPLPPEPVLTRWGTWLSAANYYSDNHRKVAEVLMPM
ncbi:uncharacterized protein LOC124794958 [Schistocerca piceifrons]|uniref:uncharacterized protein LOC124794958 n=1 Tax=Schistocerca piceifrons TaxID=274613 RepID=UPI001F5FB109|nr:uncharacterized protein LOC124794958 [Schistocerca piceifrons]